MPDISDILNRAKPRETTLPIYLDGSAASEVEQLERQLAGLADTWAPDSLAATDPSKDLAQQIQAARTRMQESAVEFRLRALGDKVWSDLLAAHPAKNADELWDPTTFPKALVAACCLDPVMTESEVGQLYEVLNEGQRGELFRAAYSVNTEATSIPFSVSASAILAALGDAK
jgi:hypothetical protein